MAEDGGSALPYDPVKEIIESRTKKSKGMQGATWGKKDEKPAEEKPADKEGDTLWNKYKEAEEQTEEKQHAPAKQPEETAEAEDSSASEAEKKTEKPKAKGLAAILEKYKKSQQDKGGMSSRTFGNLDR